MPKTDKIEYEKRVAAVQGWIIDGVNPSIIAQQIKLKGWSQSDRHAYRIIKAARLKWIEFEDESREEKRKLKIQQLQNRIRGMSHEFKNTPRGLYTILAYEKEISKLEGLYFPAPSKQAAKSNDDDDFILPPLPGPEEQGDIDYDKLPDEVLQIIISARVKHD